MGAGLRVSDSKHCVNGQISLEDENTDSSVVGDYTVGSEYHEG